MNIKNHFHPANFFGFRTARKIVVFESDDWGNERLNDKNHFNSVLNQNLINDSPYFKFDSLETNNDLESLFNLLTEFKDLNGNHPKITGNFVVANPDYETIKNNSFEKYQLIPTRNLYSNDGRRDSVLGLYNSAIRQKLFMPQYHCREHIDIDRWMKALRNKDMMAVGAFSNRFVNISTESENKRRKGITASFDFDENFDKVKFREYLQEMKKIFFDTFGFHTSSFIAPAYTWHESLEQYLSEIGIKTLQGTWKQTSPNPGGIGKAYNYIKHYTGQRNKNRQVYLVRNAFFEPSLAPGMNLVAECMARIQTAFNWRKPAIISSHRVNFIGSLVPENRDNNLKLFNELLGKITTKWPDLEFMSSDQLGNLIEGNIIKK